MQTELRKHLNDYKDLHWTSHLSHLSQLQESLSLML